MIVLGREPLQLIQTWRGRTRLYSIRPESMGAARSPVAAVAADQQPVVSRLGVRVTVASSIVGKVPLR